MDEIAASATPAALPYVPPVPEKRFRPLQYGSIAGVKRPLQIEFEKQPDEPPEKKLMYGGSAYPMW
jgi:hypothetical protein